MSESPYMRASEAAAYLKKTPKAFNHFVYAHGVKEDGRTGRIRLYTKATLDRLVQMMARRTR